MLGKDSKTDLALLKVSPKKPLAAARFGSSAGVQVGDWVMAIGNPFGLGGTVTVGIISAKARDINSGPYDDYLQTDAAINKGNSGGPLFNMNGEVVGVNTAIISPTGGSIGIGFAVPADNVARVVDQLRQYGEVRRGWLGVNVATVSEDMATQLGIKPNVGAHVASVSDNSPAKKAGIEVDDVILRFDSQEITTVRGLPKVVAETPVGKTVDVEIIRKGQRRTIKVEIARLDDADASATGKPGPGSTDTRKLMGLTLSPLTDEARKRFQLKATLKGVVSSQIDPQSPGALRDLKPGDVIVEAQDEAVNSVADLLERIEKVRKSGRRQTPASDRERKGPSQVGSDAVPVIRNGTRLQHVSAFALQRMRSRGGHMSQQSSDTGLGHGPAGADPSRRTQVHRRRRRARIAAVLRLAHAAAWIAVLAALSLAYFFRDPDRVTPVRAGLVLAPADGTVVDVQDVSPPRELGFGEPLRTRVAIHISILDVHVNRAPIAGRVARSVYVPGAFNSPTLDKAGEDNERRALMIVEEFRPGARGRSRSPACSPDGS